MDYRAEIINLIDNITDNRVLAFIYGLFDEIMAYVKKMDEVNLP